MMTGWKRTSTIALLLCQLLIQTTSFTLSPIWVARVPHVRQMAETDDHHDGDVDSTEYSMPQLPAIGSSSAGLFGHIPNASNLPKSEASPGKGPSFVGTKFELQYTCNICDTRNCHRVSRLAYRQGVVIAKCKGCQSQHLIADNLGWTDHKGGFEGDINDIEQFFQSQGKEVNRVTQEVFDLEYLLRHDTSSGSIVGNDGNLSME